MEGIHLGEWLNARTGASGQLTKAGPIQTPKAIVCRQVQR
jgi:hypothetical protein